MKTTLKRWTGASLSVALLTAGLAACGGSEETTTIDAETAAAPQETAAPETPAAPTAPAPMTEDNHDMAALPLPKRLAFMTGHVEAGLALYRAGEPQMAAPHLLHPVSETHKDERAGLDALGFDGALFEAVSKALEEGRPAEEVEPQLAAAEANLAMVAEKAGGDAAEIIQYLMDTIVEEYSISITDGVVTDANEYQDAFGFAVVARDRAEMFESPAMDLIAEIDALIALWPEAPIPPETPSPVAQVMAQTSRVLLALPST